MGNEQIMAIIDECRLRLKEIGVEDVLIGAFDNEAGGAAYSYSGNPKTLAYMANTLLLEVMFESMVQDTAPITRDEDGR